VNAASAWRRYQGLILVLGLLAGLLAFVHWSGLRQHFSVTFLRQILLGNRWEGLALYVILFSLGNLVQVPGWIFLAAAVLVLGKLDGGIVTYVTGSISCIATFLSVRWVGGNTIQQLHNPFANRLLSQLHAHPVRNMIVLRTVFQTLAALNYALAMSGIEFRKYVVATLLGLPLPIAIYCVLFDYIEKLAGLG